MAVKSILVIQLSFITDRQTAQAADIILPTEQAPTDLGEPFSDDIKSIQE